MLAELSATIASLPFANAATASMQRSIATMQAHLSVKH
jgi:hypothetical protein